MEISRAVPENKVLMFWGEQFFIRDGLWEKAYPGGSIAPAL